MINIELCDSDRIKFTVTGLIGGTTYKFIVRAKNIYDYGDFSTEYHVTAYDLPGKPI